MSVSFQAATFIPRRVVERRKQKSGPCSRATDSRASGGGRSHSMSLKIGKPLPHLGTCKHYPHSHRWMRFPCCGRRFPCDLCHEEATEDGHDVKWATRHVCGFCSTEQAIRDRCASCNKKLAFNSLGPIGSASRHWEGGLGCRDKRRLDRRDRAKYRGSKHKTISKKAFDAGGKKAGTARHQQQSA